MLLRVARLVAVVAAFEVRLPDAVDDMDVRGFSASPAGRAATASNITRFDQLL